MTNTSFRGDKSTVYLRSLLCDNSEVPKPNQKISQRERDICERLKAFRESIKWSQPDFAKHLGLTKDQLASIEYGRTPLRYDIAWKIKALFGLSVDWIWGGDNFPDDRFADAHLPIPGTDKAPENALVTEVFSTVYGPDVNDTIRTRKNPKAAPPSKEFLADIQHRAFLYSAAQLYLRDWISRVPYGYTSHFMDNLTQAARSYLEAAPKPDDEKCQEIYEAMVWEEMKRDIAKRMTELNRPSKLAHDSIKDNLDFLGSVDKVSPMSAKEVPNWAQLKKIIAKLTAGRGQKTALAKELGVSQQVLGNWLSDGGQGAPSAELTLRLFKWSLDPKRHQSK